MRTNKKYIRTTSKFCRYRKKQKGGGRGDRKEGREISDFQAWG